VGEEFTKGIDELREWDVDIWKQCEDQVPQNSAVFAQLMGIHYDLVTRMHNARHGEPERGLERGLRAMAAKCTHLVRAMWISVMAGYPGARHPLARALYETSLQIYYLRQHPDEFELWSKAEKMPAEQRRFWPSSMMKRLKTTDDELRIYRAMADAAHPNPASLSGLGGYDSATDSLELSIGQLVPIQEARHSSASVCLLAAISAFNIARNVKNSLVDGLPDEEESQAFLSRLASLTDALEKEAVKGTPIHNVFK
jgi:hypothetical protein